MSLGTDERASMARMVDQLVAEREALRHRVRELEEAMRMCGIDHSTLLKVAAAIRGRPL